MNKINYEQSLRQLEQIVAEMENGTLNVDQLSEKLKEAQKLLQQCKQKLTLTEEEIKKLVNVCENVE